MTAAALIEELTQLGVKLFPKGDRLRYRGPAAVITPELKQRIVEQKADIIATLTHAEECKPGHPSPENASRPIADRCAEALELCGELTHFYNLRAEALEAAGVPSDEANRVAMIETKATSTYLRWQALG
jgi:hypothetical protein